MTILNCSATTCVYNKNQLCSRGGIEVTGSGARHADETCCGSFREQGSVIPSPTPPENSAAAKRSISTARQTSAPTTSTAAAPQPPSTSQAPTPVPARIRNAAPSRAGAEHPLKPLKKGAANCSALCFSGYSLSVFQEIRNLDVLLLHRAGRNLRTEGRMH